MLAHHQSINLAVEQLRGSFAQELVTCRYRQPTESVCFSNCTICVPGLQYFDSLKNSITEFGWNFQSQFPSGQRRVYLEFWYFLTPSSWIDMLTGSCSEEVDASWKVNGWMLCDQEVVCVTWNFDMCCSISKVGLPLVSCLWCPRLSWPLFAHKCANCGHDLQHGRCCLCSHNRSKLMVMSAARHHQQQLEMSSGSWKCVTSVSTTFQRTSSCQTVACVMFFTREIPCKKVIFCREY